MFHSKLLARLVGQHLKIQDNVLWLSRHSLYFVATRRFFYVREEIFPIYQPYSNMRWVKVSYKRRRHTPLQIEETIIYELYYKHFRSPSSFSAVQFSTSECYIKDRTLNHHIRRRVSSSHTRNPSSLPPSFPFLSSPLLLRKICLLFPFRSSSLLGSWFRLHILPYFPLTFRPPFLPILSPRPSIHPSFPSLHSFLFMSPAFPPSLPISSLHPHPSPSIPYPGLPCQVNLMKSSPLTSPILPPDEILRVW